MKNRLLVLAHPFLQAACLQNTQDEFRLISYQTTEMKDGWPLSLSGWFSSLKEDPACDGAGKVTIACFTKNFTLLPEGVREEPEIFSQVLYSTVDGSEIIATPMGKGVKLVFVLEGALVSLIKKTFGEVEIIPDLSLLGPVSEDGVEQNGERFLKAWLLGKDLILGFSSEKEPVYFNRFQIETKDDLLYYLLLAYKSLELDPEVHPLRLYGLIEKDSEMFRHLKKYLKYVRISGTANLKVLSRFPEAAVHYFEPLLRVGI